MSKLFVIRMLVKSCTYIANVSDVTLDFTNLLASIIDDVS